MSNIKTRFCPSPSERLHLGNARTVLFNFLFAKNGQGKLLYRIEDTDGESSPQDYEQALTEDLRWLQYQWQEGIECGGEQAPYHQSQRQSIYASYFERLIKAGLAYYCFCPELDLAKARAHDAHGDSHYPGTCRHLTAEVVAENQRAGKPSLLRYKVPEAGLITFDDLVFGKQEVAHSDLDDFIIRDTQDIASSIFGNTIDDHLMAITHVIRDKRYLSQTAKEVLLQKALQLSTPFYCHLPEVTQPSGRGQTECRSITEIRAQGFLPLAVNNYMARLGHSYNNDSLLDYNALAAQFSVKHLSQSAPRYDERQLYYWQKQAIQACDNNRLWQWMGEAVHMVVEPEHRDGFMNAIRPVIHFPEDALAWAKTLFLPGLHIHTKNLGVISEAGAAYFETAIEAIVKSGLDYKAIGEALNSTLGSQWLDVYAPLRVALTNETTGPELKALLPLIGIDEVTKRLLGALKVFR